MSHPTSAHLFAKTIMRFHDSWGAQSVRDKAKICLLDYLAAALAGLSSPTCETSRQVMPSFGSGPCTCIGLSKLRSAAGAALHNGLIGHAEELDDSHRYVSGLHLAATVIPAVFALSEELHSSGDTVLVAIACGYEAAGRLCRCMDREHRARGFHSTGTVGPFGAAAACAVLLGADTTQLGNAFGIAASSSAGIFAFLENGASVKHFHAGRAALDGYMAARLAVAGMTGPDNVFEAQEGFFAAYAAGADLEPLCAETPQAELFNVYHKIHSACGHAFPAIDAALACRRALLDHNTPLSLVRHLEYASYRAAAVLDRTTPETIGQARFSVPFLIAMALTSGQTGRHDFTSALTDPHIHALSQRVSIREDPALTEAFPRLRTGLLTVTLSNGERLSFRIDVPRGMPENPVSLADITAKFHQEAIPLLGTSSAQAMVHCVAHLELSGATDELMQYLRCLALP